MAEQPHPSSAGESRAGGPPPPTDPVTAFWRDMWARYAGSAGTHGETPSATGFGAGFGTGAFLSPDAMRRMQAAFYDAMAQYAEQYMRSPQFLEAMKRSMDQALAFRQQMDSFLKSNMATAFEASTGGANSEVLGAIRQVAANLDSRLGQIEARLSQVEGAVGGPEGTKPAQSARKSPAARKPASGKRSHE